MLQLPECAVLLLPLAGDVGSSPHGKTGSLASCDKRPDREPDAAGRSRVRRRDVEIVTQLVSIAGRLDEAIDCLRGTLVAPECLLQPAWSVRHISAQQHPVGRVHIKDAT